MPREVRDQRPPSGEVPCRQRKSSLAIRIARERARYWDAVADKLGGKVEEKQSRIVEDWRDAWKWLSVQFAALASVLTGAALSNLDILAAVLSMAPPEVRGFVPIGVSVGLFAVVLLLRLWKQNR